MNINWMEIGGLICIFIVGFVVVGKKLPSPGFGRTKEEGWWDEECTQPKKWVYSPSIGGYCGLPGYWSLMPPPMPKTLTFEEYIKEHERKKK